MSNTNVKKRDWAFILYPESMPDNWEDVIAEIGCPIALSPLHDKDTASETDEEQKKAHYHAIIRFDGPTTYNNVKNVLEPLNGPIPKPINNIKGAYRYFTHKDNPEKFQYDEKDIRLFNGFNPEDVIELSASEKRSLRAAVQRLIVQEDFLEYSELMDYLLDNDLMDMYELASTTTIFFNNYIQSRRYKRQNDVKKKAEVLERSYRQYRERVLEESDPSAYWDLVCPNEK